MNTPAINTVDDYISGFPKDIQKLLQQLRKTIQKAAPLAEEYIGYKMPAYKQKGPLVYFAGYKAHIGFYPTGTGIAAFKKEISEFKNSKGAVQFPIDKPLPLDLITRMVKYKLDQNLIAEEVKRSKSLKAKKTSVKRK